MRGKKRKTSNTGCPGLFASRWPPEKRRGDKEVLKGGRGEKALRPEDMMRRTAHVLTDNYAASAALSSPVDSNWNANVEVWGLCRPPRKKN